MGRKERGEEGTVRNKLWRKDQEDCLVGVDRSMTWLYFVEANDRWSVNADKEEKVFTIGKVTAISMKEGRESSL